MLRTAGSSPYPEKIFQRAIPVPTRSAGSIRSDCPMPYQLNSWPPRPCSPNSGYSLGKPCGSEVHSQCGACNRCIVSAVPSSPDCTTNASRPATIHNKTTGSANQRRSRKLIVGMVIHGYKELAAISTDKVSPSANLFGLDAVDCIGKIDVSLLIVWYRSSGKRALLLCMRKGRWSRGRPRYARLCHCNFALAAAGFFLSAAIEVSDLELYSICKRGPVPSRTSARRPLPHHRFAGKGRHGRGLSGRC